MSEISGADAPSLKDIPEIIGRLPALDLEARSSAADLLKAAGGAGRLGRLGDFCLWLAAAQGRARPRLEIPNLSLFAGAYGVALRLGEEDPTSRRVAAAIEGSAAINRLAGLVDADLRVYELALEQPCGDITEGPAMDEATAARAMTYGMVAIEETAEIFGLVALGAGSEIAGAALAKMLIGGKANDWAAGPAESELVTSAVAANPGIDDPLIALQALGGLDMAAVAGGIIAARMAGAPVVLDGFGALAAAAVLWRLDCRALDHCALADGTSHPGVQRLARELGLPVLQSLDLASAPGTAAALSIGLLRGAASLVAG